MPKPRRAITTHVRSARESGKSPPLERHVSLTRMQMDAVVEYVILSPAVRRQLALPGTGLKSLSLGPRELERLTEAIIKAAEASPNHRIRQQLIAAKARCQKGMKEEK